MKHILIVCLLVALAGCRTIATETISAATGYKLPKPEPICINRMGPYQAMDLQSGQMYQFMMFR